jgi:enoyl-CoA hydratase
VTDSLVITDVRDGIAVLTLNRPEARNALSPELTRAIQDAVADLDAREDVAVVIMTGADPAFCAGVDLKRLAAAEQPGQIATRDPWPGALPPHTTPVIGAINGPTVTGGFELALACDFLLASERATFADTHARVGVMPGWGLTIRLPELIGINRARQMSFTGDFIDARRAYEWGLVNEVVPHDDLLTRARQVATSIVSVPAENVREIRAIYAEMNGLVGAAAWEQEVVRSQEWMARRFDQGRLAAVHEDIIRRGRDQQ